MSEAGSKDVPEHCPKCKQTTLFRPDREGTYHCLRCLAGAASAPPAAGPATVNVTMKKQPDGIMVGTMKVAGFIVALIILLCAVTCVAGLGMCGKVVSDVKHASGSGR